VRFAGTEETLPVSSDIIRRNPQRIHIQEGSIKTPGGAERGLRLRPFGGKYKSKYDARRKQDNPPASASKLALGRKKLFFIEVCQGRPYAFGAQRFAQGKAWKG